MSIKERLSEELKLAMKARDNTRISTIRMVVSIIKNREIDGRTTLDDEAALAVLTTYAKQRRDSIEQYEKGGRADLVEKEKAELAIILSFMPEQMGEAEVEALVIQAVKDSGAAGPKDMGKVMKELMPKVKGKADGKLVNELVKKHLGG
ncbi:MAG TPA: GatB/YqeY domain-containing protein [Nitrospirota bacterium]|jgi:hypothetical protein